MGHDQSNLSGLELDERVVEVAEFWSQHTATINGGNLVSVLVGEPLVGGSLWISKTPLEKAAKVNSFKITKENENICTRLFLEFNALSTSVYIKIHFFLA